MSNLFCFALSSLLLFQRLEVSSSYHDQSWKRVRKGAKNLFSFCLIALFFATSSNLHAQIRFQSLGKNKADIERNISRMLEGPGVTIKNLKIQKMGNYRQIAEFSNGLENRTPNIGIGQGVVLSTGDASTLEKKRKDQKGKHYNKRHWDSDLAQLFQGNPKQYDHVIITFELIPLANNLSIDFVFGSDEYEQYVDTKFVDAYGFFISGPGINGSHSDSGINVAKLPSGDPVSTNYVNRKRNSDYYIRNPEVRFDVNNGWQASSYRGNHVALNGWTKVVTSSLPVQVNKPYKVKLAIADGVDGWYDASVFIGKFKSERQFNGRLFQYRAGTVDEKKLAVGDTSFSYFQSAKVILLNKYGIKVDEARTGPRGEYSFFVKDQGAYTVVVDSSTLSKNKSVIPEQSWSSIGGICADGLGGYRELAQSGYCYGGKAAGISDHISDNSFDQAQHVIRIPAGKADAENLNFGFSYDVVTHPNDTGQGSLRQFIENTNNNTGTGKMLFVPAVAENSDRGWKITLQSDLPSLNRSGASINGLAWSYLDSGRKALTDKTLKMSTGAGDRGQSTEPFLAQDLELAAYEPRLNQLLFMNGSNQIASHLVFNGSGSQSNSLRAIRTSASCRSCIIEDNLIGLSALGDQRTPRAIYAAIEAEPSSNVTIRHNWITGTDQAGINFSGSGLIEQNLLLDNGKGANTSDAISLESSNTYDQSRTVIITKNYIDGVNAFAIDGWRFPYPKQLSISDNTITGAGRAHNPQSGEGEGGGVRLQGSNDSGKNIIVTGNIFVNNRGPGVVVSNFSSSLRAKGNLITRNRFERNSGLPIDLVFDGNKYPSGDGENANTGGYDFSHGTNLGIDRPIISNIIRDAKNQKLIIEGFAMPGVTLEFYRNAEYYYDRKEGGPADMASSRGSYKDPVSGKTIHQNKFRFEEPLSLYNIIDFISVIAIDNKANTSEFSAEASNVHDDGYLEGGLWHDKNNNGQWDNGEPGLDKIVVNLYKMHGNEKKSILIKTLTTNSQGRFSVERLPVGSYQLTVPEQPGLKGFQPGAATVNPLSIKIKPRQTVQALFGYIQGEAVIRLTPNHSRSTQPGVMVTFPHKLLSSVDGNAVLSTELVNKNGVTINWPVTLKQLSCESDNKPSNMPGSLKLKADDSVCLQASFFVPADAPFGLKAVLNIKADFVQTDKDNTVSETGKGSAVISVSATDTVTVSDKTSGQLILKKWVENITQGDGRSTSNKADSGDILQYTIRFANTGVAPIKQLEISDQTPPFTVLSGAVNCPTSHPESLGKCDLQLMGADGNGLGFTGKIFWRFPNGSLLPGESGEVSYRVKVE